jgi:uncharacterized protein YcfJ
MDLYSRTQEYGCGSCFGESDLMSSQTLAGSGSAWYKQTAKAMDSLSQGLSKSARNLTTKKQRKELAEIGIDALKQKTNPTGAAIEQFDDLYLTGKGDCGEVASYPASPKKALQGKGAKKALEKVGAGARKVAKKAKPNKKTQKKMAKGAVGGAIAGGITGAAAGGPAGAAAGVAAGAVGGATGAYVEGKM